jgi:simple sugar transport system permease protein
MGNVLAGVVATAIASGTVIVLAALGEVLAERSGVLNLGLEGIMAVGAVTAIITVNVFSGTAYAGLLVAILAGMLLGVLFAVATVIFKANQTLCGLALSFLGTGLAGRLGAPYAGQPAQARFERIPIPILSDIPLAGNALFNHNILVYLAYLVLPAIISYLLYRTRHGMNVRAVGENPAAADASGIGVSLLRFSYTCVGAALSATGGAYLTLAFTPAWSEGVTGGRGWIAIALVIFAGWRPVPPGDIRRVETGSYCAGRADLWRSDLPGIRGADQGMGDSCLLSVYAALSQHDGSHDPARPAEGERSTKIGNCSKRSGFAVL